MKGLTGSSREADVRSEGQKAPEGNSRGRVPTRGRPLEPSKLADRLAEAEENGRHGGEPPELRGERALSEELVADGPCGGQAARDDPRGLPMLAPLRELLPKSLHVAREHVPLELAAAAE